MEPSSVSNVVPMKNGGVRAKAMVDASHGILMSVVDGMR
jgi:hypothetical protein